MPPGILTAVDPRLEIPQTPLPGPARILTGTQVLDAPAQAPLEALDRRDLIRVLRDCAIELGVAIESGATVSGSSDPRLGPCDLVIAADGAGSLMRHSLAGPLAPEVHLGRDRFVAFNSRRRFPQLSLILAEHATGPWLARAYSYAPDRSSFIVECSERTWMAAGLDQRSPDDSCRLLGAVFEQALEGERLTTDGPLRWRQFPTVRNRVWSHEKVVLLGDAAHTAHFGTGAGTAEAIRDAVALNRALLQTPSLEALPAFERARRPQVELEQRNASEWRVFFEDLLLTLERGDRAEVDARLAHCGGQR